MPVDKPRMHVALDRDFVHLKLLCLYQGHACIFVTGSNVWVPMYTADAMVELGSAMDMTNATVQYDETWMPYITYAMRNCASMAPLTRSFCVGTRRYRIVNSPTSDCAESAQVERFIDHLHKGCDARMGRSCYKPVFLHSTSLSLTTNLSLIGKLQISMRSKRRLDKRGHDTVSVRYTQCIMRRSLQ